MYTRKISLTPTEVRALRDVQLSLYESYSGKDSKDGIITRLGNVVGSTSIVWGVFFPKTATIAGIAGVFKGIIDDESKNYSDLLWKGYKGLLKIYKQIEANPTRYIRCEMQFLAEDLNHKGDIFKICAAEDGAVMLRAMLSNGQWVSLY